MWTITATEPSYEPITTAEARDHLRLTATGSPESHPDDTLVDTYISAARAWAESYTNRYFAERTVTLKTQQFSEILRLPVAPVFSVDSVKYIDDDGVEQTLASSEYELNLDYLPPRIWFQDIPSVDQDTLNAVTITIQAGYESSNSPASADAIPVAVKQAVKLLVGHWYENRESVVIGETAQSLPMSVESLLWPHRVVGL